MQQMLKSLVDAHGITGYEKNVREVMSKEMKKNGFDVKVDRIGNVIARKGSGSPKVMISAHMDQIGLIVKYVNKKGFIFFDRIGGWDERVLPAKRVLIHGSKGPVLGVIGAKPVHIQEKDEQKKPFKFKDMFIDIGASGEVDVKKAGISVGDFITSYGSIESLKGTRVTSHGFDNRAGCLVLTELGRNVKKFKGTLYLVGTIKEEIGLFGVRGSGFGIDPDVLLVLDSSIAGDTPGIDEKDAPHELGGGPILGLKDAMGVIDSKVRKWVTETSKKNRIKIQPSVMSGGSTEASVGPIIREGVPSGAIEVPVRNIHTPVEVADMRDIEACVKLCVKLVESADKYF